MYDSFCIIFWFGDSAGRGASDCGGTCVSKALGRGGIHGYWVPSSVPIATIRTVYSMIATALVPQWEWPSLGEMLLGLQLFTCVCVVHIRNRSFYPSTSSTPSARADSSIPHPTEIHKFCGHIATPHRDNYCSTWYVVMQQAGVDKATNAASSYWIRQASGDKKNSQILRTVSSMPPARDCKRKRPTTLTRNIGILSVLIFNTKLPYIFGTDWE